MIGKGSIRKRLLTAATVVASLVAGGVLPAPAHAASAWWQLNSASQPTNLPPGKSGKLILSAVNLGNAEADGTSSSIVLTDKLPDGVAATTAIGRVGGVAGFIGARGPVKCSVADPSLVECAFEGTLPPYEQLQAEISVDVQPDAESGAAEELSVAGGEAGGTPLRGDSASIPLVVSGAPTEFGVENYELTAFNEDGTLDTQAGSHPFGLTTTLALDRTAEAPYQPALPKDLHFALPTGLVGNPTPFPQCSDKEFVKGANFVDECPADTALGAAVVTVYEPLVFKLITVPVPVFNLKPFAGEPARFGFDALGITVVLDTSVRTGSDYGVTVSVNDITQDATLLASQVTFWGVPGAENHDQERGWSCIAGGIWQTLNLGLLAPCAPPEHATTPPPFLSLPTSCTGPLASSVAADSWQRKGDFASFPPRQPMASLDGCNRMPFKPAISVAPDLEAASSPSGLTVGVRVPQALVLDPTALAESNLKDTTVTLPPGVTLDPSGAGGLEACTEQEIGFLGKNEHEPALNEFTDGYPTPFCPDASKVGTVMIHTPLLPNPLEGAVYLASPAPNGEAGQNPFETLVSMYIVAEDPVSGTLVKLPGKVLACEHAGEVLSGVTCEAEGQLVSTFEDTPELPFETLELHFFGGSRAPLATPALCGAYTTQASFTPWSGNAPVASSSTFDVTSGPNKSACPSDSLPFAPGFNAGTTNIQAGSFTPLTTTMGHPDGDQVLGGLRMKMPPGLLGSLAKVKLCGEPQAAQGTCGPESLIGHTVVTAGLGDTPAVVKRPGNVYITGPYKGAPYGLSIVNPAEAGPFNLGQVVVRAKIEVDPHTAQLTITSDPLPRILKGIPLLLQHVNVSVERPEFTFNPTNCSAMKIEGSISGGQGASVPVSTPFQVTNCARLPFKPGFKAKTKRHHTRKGGAYLRVHVTSGNGQANIARAHVELPKKLPSRLSTLQKACTESQFDADPAGCPAESDVGSVTVHTPVLPVPLTGPAYFVSRGAQWPELIMVLQGYGITVDLAGETHISKKGITSTTLGSVPDVPFTSFTLTLPEGPHSALAGNGNLCKKHLYMPVKLTGQNGKTLKQKTKIKVSGCASAKKKRRKGRKRGKGTAEGARRADVAHAAFEKMVSWSNQLTKTNRQAVPQAPVAL